MAGSYESINGTIASAWERTEGGLTLEVTVPANTTATVFIPAAEGATVTEGDNPVQGRWEDGYRVVEVGSGSYGFAVRPQP